MSTPDTRYAQRFPTLTEAEIERMRRFGEPRAYGAGERLYVAGEPSPGMYVLLTGQAVVTHGDGLGHVVPIVTLGPGQFLAEVGELTGRRTLVDAHAVDDITTLLIAPERLRALLIAEANLGERIMRALILRRVSLIETGAGGPVLVGPHLHPDMVRLQGFLARNGCPHTVLDPADDPDAAALIERYAPDHKDLPLAVCASGTVLKNPSEAELARCLGLVPADGPDRIFDVAVVGAGPAGLATAVYAASEGLSVMVLDRRAFGGQAGASARIENYLGFPTGITGQALAGRAYVQAEKFGAEFAVPAETVRLDCATPTLAVELTDGRRVQARTVVVASGARYRRPALANLPDFEGRGVWYWASPIEARMCRSEEVVLVGGGNSAGQAAVYLSGFAAKVRMLVRGPNLAASMSRYLIDRIEAAANIELTCETEIVGLSGSRTGWLERVRWRHAPTGAEEERTIRNVFLFIGADPATDWLRDCGVQLCPKGFVATGADITQDGSHGGPRLRLQSSVPGVFAVGDVRSGSVKRVGGAIGEGAAVVAELHSYLAALPAPATAAP